jgi:hypothetical protein
VTTRLVQQESVPDAPQVAASPLQLVARQVRSLVALPGVSSTVFAPHGVHCVQLAAPAALKLPAPHAMQLLAFIVALNVPAAQAVHCRSVVAVPADDTRCPAMQSVHGTHAPPEA